MQLAATTNPNPHALRVLTKNYRCRIFNCQRAFSSGALPRTPARFTRSALRPRSVPLARESCQPLLADRNFLFYATHAPSSSAAGVAKPSGEYRARTGDLLVANQALSQLS